MDADVECMELLYLQCLTDVVVESYELAVCVVALVPD